MVVIGGNTMKRMTHKDVLDIIDNAGKNRTPMEPKRGDRTIKVLCDLLEWAKGNRGSKEGNPYLMPEVKAALQHLADLQGIKTYYYAKTKQE